MKHARREPKEVDGGERFLSCKDRDATGTPKKKKEQRDTEYRQITEHVSLESPATGQLGTRESGTAPALRARGEKGNCLMGKSVRESYILLTFWCVERLKLRQVKRALVSYDLLIFLVVYRRKETESMLPGKMRVLIRFK